MADDEVESDVPNPWVPGSPRRFLLGFATASLLPLIPFIFLWPTGWPFILIFGIAYFALAYFPVVIAYTMLAFRGRLSLWWAMGVGALSTSFPLLFLSVLSSLRDPLNAWASLIQGLAAAAPLALLGVFTGSIGWVIAYGWRTRYP